MPIRRQNPRKQDEIGGRHKVTRLHRSQSGLPRKKGAQARTNSRTKNQIVSSVFGSEFTRFVAAPNNTELCVDKRY